MHLHFFFWAISNFRLIKGQITRSVAGGSDNPKVSIRIEYRLYYIILRSTCILDSTKICSVGGYDHIGRIPALNKHKQYNINKPNYHNLHELQQCTIEGNRS